MFAAFRDFLNETNLLPGESPTLLAVSGGIDSVCMAHLFHAAGLDFGIAHCNFQLRGADADADEAFVEELAKGLNKRFYAKRFDVAAMVEEEGISVQMAARKLRYSWFEDLLDQHNFEQVATAHNLNDAVETVVMNLIRGTGIKGLTGIPVRNGRVIRPLLFATRADIEGMVRTLNLPFREDRSNRETKYHRNRIRHELIPVMQAINPAFLETFRSNMAAFEGSREILEVQTAEKRLKLFNATEQGYCIRVGELQKLFPLKAWLYELFSPYGFNQAQCKELEGLLEADSGKQLQSPSYCIYKDREHLFLNRKKEQPAFERYYIDEPGSEVHLPFRLKLEVLQRDELEAIPGEAETACLDLDKLNFPLIFRRWQDGDYFYPLGMGGMKKLSDFFIDRKIPLPQKASTWIMCSGKKIVWVMGQRIDHRFRITPTTQRVLLLRFEPDVSTQFL